MFSRTLDSSEEIGALADLLVGAARSDRFYAASELIVIVTILCDELGVNELPAELTARLKSFDPETFDVEAACARLPLDGPDDRRALLQLIARVINADAVVHDIEDDYLDQVALAIGAKALVRAQDFAQESTEG